MNWAYSHRTETPVHEDHWLTTVDGTTVSVAVYKGPFGKYHTRLFVVWISPHGASDVNHVHIREESTHEEGWKVGAERAVERMRKYIAALHNAFSEPVAKLAEAQAAVRLHMNEKGHDRCWMDDVRLYETVLPEGHAANFTLPPKEEFLANCGKFCSRFWENRQPKPEGQTHDDGYLRMVPTEDGRKTFCTDGHERPVPEADGDARDM